jgi:hypothetical protein
MAFVVEHAGVVLRRAVHILRSIEKNVKDRGISE